MQGGTGQSALTSTVVRVKQEAAPPESVGVGLCLSVSLLCVPVPGQCMARVSPPITRDAVGRDAAGPWERGI